MRSEAISGLVLSSFVGAAYGFGAGLPAGVTEPVATPIPLDINTHHMTNVDDVAACTAQIHNLRTAYVKSNGTLDIVAHLMAQEKPVMKNGELRASHPSTTVFRYPENVKELDYTVTADVERFALGAELVYDFNLFQCFNDEKDPNDVLPDPDKVYVEASKIPNGPEASLNGQYAIYAAQNEIDGHTWINFDDHDHEESAKGCGPRYSKGHRSDYVNVMIEGRGPMEGRVMMAYCTFQEDGLFGPAESDSDPEIVDDDVWQQDFMKKINLNDFGSPFLAADTA